MNNCGHLSIRPTSVEDGAQCIECRKYACKKCISSLTTGDNIPSLEKMRNVQIKKLQSCFNQIEMQLFSSIELFNLSNTESQQLKNIRKTFNNLRDLFCICIECSVKTSQSSFVTKLYNKTLRSENYYDCCKNCSEWKETIYIRSTNNEFYFICVDCGIVWTKKCDNINLGETYLKSLTPSTSSSIMLSILEGIFDGALHGMMTVNMGYLAQNYSF